MGSMVISNAAVDEAAVAFWSEWDALPDKTEENLSNYVSAVTSMLGELSYERNLEALGHLWELYRYAESRFRMEPFRTIYEQGLMHFTICFADNHYIAGKFEEALDDVEAVLRYLELMDRRRERKGLPRRPNSVLRLSALTTLASVKLECKPSKVNRIYTPEDVIRRFWRTTNRLFKNMDEVNATERLREDAMALLAYGELQICKLALLHVPKLVGKAIRIFNTHHGSHLTLRAEHFRKRSAIIRNAWYWDFELFKLMQSDKPKAADLRYLDEQRRKTARLAFTSFTVLSHYEVWDRQMEALGVAGRTRVSPA